MFPNEWLTNHNSSEYSFFSRRHYILFAKWLAYMKPRISEQAYNTVKYSLINNVFTENERFDQPRFQKYLDELVLDPNLLIQAEKDSNTEQNEVKDPPPHPKNDHANDESEYGKNTNYFFRPNRWRY